MSRNYTGNRFGRLVVIQSAGKDKRARILLECLCDCGGRVCVRHDSLVSGNTTSCGCYALEERSRGATRHSLTGTRTHKAWSGMRYRCSNPNHEKYDRYGGRGISVCPQWSSFDVFLKDMGICPPGKSIDRIDPNGNYEPSNCRWADQVTQCNNRSSNRMLVAFGESKTLSEWSKDPRCVVMYCTLKARLNKGWPPETALLRRRKMEAIK